MRNRKSKSKKQADIQSKETYTESTFWRERQKGQTEEETYRKNKRKG